MSCLTSFGSSRNPGHSDKKEPTVEGVSIQDCTVKISQFADDLTVFVASRGSAERLLRMVETVGTFFGLTQQKQVSATGAGPKAA